MIYSEGKGQETYKRVYQAALEQNQVGVYLHMRRPTAPLSRLGFRGKRPSKKTLKELAEKLLDKALSGNLHPSLIPAVVNLSKYR